MQISTEVLQYLTDCGLSKKKLLRCKFSTRIYHDLGVYGDVAEAYMEVLEDQYNVDLDGFKFRDYFPPEYAGNNMLMGLLLWAVPFAGGYVRKQNNYLPLTLQMINTVISTKKWQSLGIHS